MRWKRALWLGCLAPVFGGCLHVDQSRHDAMAEHGVAQSERDIVREIHKKAREAWVAVRSEFPRKLFTPEFRDGFIEGYTDYLDRGGDAQPPVVPPMRYTQNKKYFTPEGHVLVRDYFLGFKYGADVAVATGQRQYLTVPVLIADKGEAIEALPFAPGSMPIPPLSGSDAPVKPVPAPAPQPLPSPRPMSRLPLPRKLPNEQPPARVSTVPDLEEGSKFGPPPPLKRGVPEIAPVPSIPGVPSIPAIPVPGGSSSRVSPIIQASGVKLPEPPSEVLNLDPDLPTPPFVYEIPDLPPLPVNHPDPVKK